MPARGQGTERASMVARTPITPKKPPIKALRSGAGAQCRPATQSRASAHLVSPAWLASWAPGLSGTAWRAQR